MDATAAVIVPTYRRPQDLDRCLLGVFAQTRRPDEVVVACRSDDGETEAVLARWIDRVVIVHSEQPGQVSALKAGVTAAKSCILAFLDDDAVPRPDWLERIVVHFREPNVGAVGGRDVVHLPDGIVQGEADVIGVVTPLGRIIGNHHVGRGAVREVDILKGVNCAYRRSTYGAPIGLRGSGAEVGNDLASSLRVRTQGSVVLYDPLLIVDHFPGIRHDEDERSIRTRKADLDVSYNLTLAVLSLRPELKWRYIAYELLVGGRASPGIVRALYSCFRGDLTLLRKVGPTQRSIWEAARVAANEGMAFWTLDNEECLEQESSHTVEIDPHL